MLLSTAFAEKRSIPLSPEVIFCHNFGKEMQEPKLTSRGCTMCVLFDQLHVSFCFNIKKGRGREEQSHESVPWLHRLFNLPLVTCFFPLLFLKVLGPFFMRRCLGSSFRSTMCMCKRAAWASFRDFTLPIVVDASTCPWMASANSSSCRSWTKRCSALRWVSFKSLAE